MPKPGCQPGKGRSVMKSLDRRNGALVLVDYQQRLLPALHGGARAVDEALFLARLARLLGLPVMATEQNPAGLGPNVKVLRDLCAPTLPKMHFDACRDGLLQALHASVAPGEPGDVVPVSYTHLDVYKRQNQGRRHERLTDESGQPELNPRGSLPRAEPPLGHLQFQLPELVGRHPREHAEVPSEVLVVVIAGVQGQIQPAGLRCEVGQTHEAVKACYAAEQLGALGVHRIASAVLPVCWC